MEYKHIKSNEVAENNFGSVVVQNLLMDDNYKKFSIAKIKVVGKQKFGYSTERDAAYYVLDGSGEFFIENNIIEVKKGDLVFIPKGVKYKDSGQLTLLAISVPMFDINRWVSLETE